MTLNYALFISFRPTLWFRPILCIQYVHLAYQWLGLFNGILVQNVAIRCQITFALKIEYLRKQKSSLFYPCTSKKAFSLKYKHFWMVIKSLMIFYIQKSLILFGKMIVCEVLEACGLICMHDNNFLNYYSHQSHQFLQIRWTKNKNMILPKFSFIYLRRTYR